MGKLQENKTPGAKPEGQLHKRALIGPFAIFVFLPSNTPQCRNSLYQNAYGVRALFLRIIP